MELSCPSGGQGQLFGGVGAGLWTKKGGLSTGLNVGLLIMCEGAKGRTRTWAVADIGGGQNPKE